LTDVPSVLLLLLVVVVVGRGSRRRRGKKTVELELKALQEAVQAIEVSKESSRASAHLFRMGQGIKIGRERRYANLGFTPPSLIGRFTTSQFGLVLVERLVEKC
jgi:hypothetical protein